MDKCRYYELQRLFHTSGPQTENHHHHHQCKFIGRLPATRTGYRTCIEGGKCRKQEEQHKSRYDVGGNQSHFFDGAPAAPISTCPLSVRVGFFTHERLGKPERAYRPQKPPTSGSARRQSFSLRMPPAGPGMCPGPLCSSTESIGPSDARVKTFFTAKPRCFWSPADATKTGVPKGTLGPGYAKCVTEILRGDTEVIGKIYLFVSRENIAN